LSRVGRPKEHGAATRDALLDAGEQLVAEGGPDAISVRAVADLVGTSTRAVYSVFGSKDGLLAALRQRTFDLLATAIAALPETDDPAQDLVEAAVHVFRAMTIDHPSLYRMTFLNGSGFLELGQGVYESSRRGFELLCRRVERLEATGGLGGGRDATEAACQFHALCEGLATFELRSPIVLGPDPERVWRDAIAALVTGLATPAPGSEPS